MQNHDAIEDEGLSEDALTEELKLRWAGLASSIEAMGGEAAKLLGALSPGYLPDAVLRDVEAKTRPFSQAIRNAMAECAEFQDLARRIQEASRSRKRAVGDFEDFFAAPTVGKVVN